MARAITILLGGDVMCGRGVDQVLPHPGDPMLSEEFVRDARTYVAFAESANGPIPRPVDFGWPCGEALGLLEQLSPDVRIINLETSITRSAQFAPGKAVHYRMSPDNIGCLTALKPDVCALANNHVLDFGRPGLLETLDSLAGAGLTAAGAGRDAHAAADPAVLDTARPTEQDARVLVVCCGMQSSGIPEGWAATADRPGVNLIAAPSDAAADALVDLVNSARRAGDLAVVSVHWGSNWGYQVDAAERRFAHRLVDGGIDVVHGHSSHHPRPIEVYRGKLVLYGCGDLVNDYEGISGHEQYRSDLRVLYLASADDAGLIELRMAVMRARRFRLEPAPADDAGWLRAELDRVSAEFATRVETGPDGLLVVRRP